MPPTNEAKEARTPSSLDQERQKLAGLLGEFESYKVDFATETDNVLDWHYYRRTNSLPTNSYYDGFYLWLAFQTGPFQSDNLVPQKIEIPAQNSFYRLSSLFRASGLLKHHLTAWFEDNNPDWQQQEPELIKELEDTSLFWMEEVQEKNPKKYKQKIKDQRERWALMEAITSVDINGQSVALHFINDEPELAIPIPAQGIQQPRPWGQSAA